ncbi:lysophospholipid acyltransferase family protein [Anaeromyxobacter diazotrophicus]|uniref:1-acyl-sn-glycerol-3-phosphate acyltransferase n=1 Tax=Anaeromyxobacter diazotrophicus TaxID=2590199 RepID=A0A7I9VT08_9BACT|nr:lysophospholipid acyltransferase family protein [Anaeromyxobacter diazotrophicus]GEJ59545.1 1-acyl-sn-glycerol-3-phosphate acyltransferase [Anaeromyxobacter diazotrophicus]
MIRAFSLVYWVFVVATMPVFFAGALLVFLATVAFDRRRVALHLYSCFWASFYIYANPLWRVRFEGRERLPWHGPAVIVANHLSLVDILVLYGLYRPFKWVSKAELFRVPVVGWNMVINDYVRLTRGDRESIRAMMEHCRAHLARGAPVLIFPEGTRSQDGRLQAFKDGAFRLAHEAKVPLIPVVIQGTHETVPKHGLVLRQRMRGRVKVLAPLDPAAFPDVLSLKQAAREAIARELGEAEAPASAPA